jgi:DNA repair exonuclease SbcCD nuclease subunit
MNLFNYVVISDLHLGSKRLSVETMIKSIMITIAPLVNSSLDFLFITGDVYDSLITDCDSIEAKRINGFITWVTSTCSKYDITLIVLKGTTNHDFRQCENFVHINNGLAKPCDLRYFDKVGVHFIRGMSILAVPDNAATTIAGVKALVEIALKDAGVTQVHVALTHGLYSHHILAGFSDEFHDTEFYLSITKILLINGHVHTSQLYKHHKTVGSFDRTAQGEEEAKGGAYGIIDIDSGTYTCLFLENKFAHIFRCMVLPHNLNDAAEAYSYVLDNLETMVETGGWLSVEPPAHLDITETISRLNHTAQGKIVFSIRKVKNKDKDKDKITFTRIESKPISPATLTEMLSEKLTRDNVIITPIHLEIMKEIACITN